MSTLHFMTNFKPQIILFIFTFHLGLFYKIRTSNIFRVQEIVQDLNDERPVWIGSKSEIIANLEFYGIIPTEKEKTTLMSSSEVFEIDCESLFYFELERFSKASAAFGTNVMNYFECIHQDGSAYPREFYPDTKPIFQSELIYNVFTEMQVMTDMFVTLSTGIDLEILSIHALPNQIRHSGIASELRLVEDFMYNFYLRVYPRERSTASITRVLPKLPVIYEKVPEGEEEMRFEPVVEEEEVEDEVFEEDNISLNTMGTMDTMDLIEEPPPPSKRGREKKSSKSIAMMASKQKLRAVSVYKSLAERVKQSKHKDYTYEESVPADSASSSGGAASEASTSRTAEWADPRHVRFQQVNESPRSSPLREPTLSRSESKKSKKSSESSKTPQRPPSIPATVDSVREAMKYRYRAPVRRDGYNRRRGKLRSKQNVQHNAFSYMVCRVLGFLEGHLLTEEELQNKTFISVDRTFIV